ncbi:MAG: hypothetical protein H0W94_03285 [Actinobacteria bacterium]|nr:hypothetical protein [Actinomycetota bacterium]
MGSLVELGRWRERRGAAPLGMDRLERAVEELDRLTSALLREGRALEGPLETELLALIGELSMGMLDEASGRAERLVGRLHGLVTRRAGRGG